MSQARGGGPTLRLLVAGLAVLGTACHRGSQPPPVTRPVTALPTTPAAPAPTTIASAPTLFRAMHDRYNNNWYRTVTFVQKTTIITATGGQIVQTWYEAGMLPGRLRIDTDRRSKTGTLYARDSVFTFNSGKLVKADTGLNELLVLGFDVYAMPVDRTASLLRRLGFDLSRFHESTWQGKPVYVVGALAGDTTSKQFYVDRDRLLFLRVITSTPRGRADTRYSDYVQYGGGWVATQVEQYVNGRRTVL